MTAVAYVNGVYRRLGGAAVSVQDRGFQFGDAVYEVWGVRDGRLLDTEGHLRRLARSLGELRIAAPMSDAALTLVVREVVRRNRVRDGLAYLQVSRGAAPRDHAFPDPPVSPTVVLTAKSLDRAALDARAAKGVSVITLPEIRWARCDIKSVNLLPNVMARQQAREAGAAEAWFVDAEGYVTEGTASNAWIVDSEGRLRTRELSNRILHGVTRATMLRIAEERHIPIVQAPFTLAEAKDAREAFMTAATNPGVPIVAIDGVKIGAGAPGPVALALRHAYFGQAAET